MNSKSKGARFERTIANYFKDYGYDTRRTAQYCGKSGDAADVVGLPNIHIECKHYKDIGWRYEWLEQAKRDCKADNIPIVVHKTNGKPTLVTMDIDDFMKIYNESSYADGGTNE